MGVTTVVKDYGTAILNAIRDNDIKTLRAIFEKHLKYDGKIAALCVTDIKHKPTKKFACPLILAARQEDPTIIRYMLERGVDPNFVHHTIYTSKRREIVTALHIGVDLGLFATVEALLNANADPNIVDHNDETSLHIAVKKADRVMTRMLLAKGADPSIIDRRGNASLHIATLFGHLQLVKTLLKYDADVYQKGQFGAIPSHIAAKEGHIHLIQVFCSRDNGNINIKIPCYSDQREKAPIHLAAENGHVETLIALLDQFNAEVNLKDSDGNTPLHCVVLNPYHPYKMRDKDYFYATAKVLVKYRVSINEKNKFGETALHLAAANQFQKIVELLLSIGANPFAENDRNLKPIDVVPESDPVTRQLLKTAMLNPQAQTLSASMISLQKDLNISGMGFPSMMSSSSHHRNRPLPLVANGIPPRYEPTSKENMSFRSASSMSSVFVDDVKARQMALQMPSRSHRGQHQPSTTDERHRKHDSKNEIALYTQVSKKGRKESKDRQQTKDSGSTMGSQMSINSLDEPVGHGGKTRESGHKSRSHRHSPVDNKNAKNDRQRKNEADEKYKYQTTPEKDRRGDRKGQNHIYENVKLRSPRHHRQSEEEEDDNDDNFEDKRLRTDKRQKEKRTKDLKKGLVRNEALVEYDDDDEDAEEGVKVHTFPGKPSTIEVQYNRGPITISVDTGNSYDAIPQNEGEDDDEEDEDEERQKVSKKKKSKRRKDEDEEEEEEDEEEKHYINQEMIMAELRQKQKRNEKELLKRRKSLEERESRTREEAERRREELDEEERKARKEEEKERKRNRKLMRKKMRQEQFELEQEFDRMPTEEEAPERRPFVLQLPEEVVNEPSFDSDEFEEEQKKSKRALALATKRIASATTDTLKQRWSQDEGEDDEEMERFKTKQGIGVRSKHGQPGMDAPVAARRSTKVTKPPRPAYSSQSSAESEQQKNVEEEEGNEKEIKPSETVIVERLAEKDRGVQPVFQTMLRETNPNDIIRMETVFMLRSQENQESERKLSEAEFLEYSEDSPGVTSSQNDILIRKGLNMRVTGEVPKAYNRQEKSSARTAFMKATPVGIESSSEASDSELGGSRTSLLGRIESPTMERSAQRRREWSERDRNSNSISTSGSDNAAQQMQKQAAAVAAAATEKEDTNKKVKIIGGYPKPYQSFGKIEPKTDALENAILEYQNSLDEQRSSENSTDEHRHGNQLSTFSPTASTEVKVNFDSNSKSNESPSRNRVASSPVSQDVNLPTILNSPTKVSKQFPGLKELDQQQSSETKGVTSMNGVKETDIVSTESDDDFFDDESFDDVSENELKELTEKNKSMEKSQQQKTKKREKEKREMKPKKIIGTPTAFSPPEDMSKSTESLGALKDDLEVYDREPGARKPKQRTGKTDDVIKKGTTVENGTVVDDHLQPEDREVALINSVAEEKHRSKKPKKTRRQEVVDMNEKNGAEIVEMPSNEAVKTKKSKIGGQKKTGSTEELISATSLSSDVWKEAMQSQPLASSEMYADLSATTHEIVPQDISIASENINDISADFLTKSGKKKKHQPQKNVVLVSELQKNLKFLQQKTPDAPSLDNTEEDVSFTNNLDIIIPPIESKWKDIQDDPLNISIPTTDTKYFAFGRAGNVSDQNVKTTRGKNSGRKPLSEELNLDDIIIPAGQSDHINEDSFGTLEGGPSPERIVGRRQQRLSKQRDGVSLSLSPNQTLDNSGTKTHHSTSLETNIDEDWPGDSSPQTTLDDNELKTKIPKKEGKDLQKKQKKDEECHNVPVLVSDQSFDDDMDVLPPGVRTKSDKMTITPSVVSRQRPKKSKGPTTVTGLVKPPVAQKPSIAQKPSYPSDVKTISMKTEDKEKIKPTAAASPTTRYVQPSTGNISARPWSTGAEIVEVPYGKIEPYSDGNRPPAAKALPRYPARPINGGPKSAMSDTEIGMEQRRGKYGRFGPIHSEAEASDLEQPRPPGPGKTYRQAALDTINAGIQRPRYTFVLRQPGHHDKSFNYLKKLYKPQHRRSVTSHLIANAGRYGDSELARMRSRSWTLSESEGDTDNDASYLHDDETKNIGPARRKAAPVPTGGGVPQGHRQPRQGPRRPGGHVSRIDQPPSIMEPGPVDFSKFDVTARLWMELVDKKTVQKSKTMFLSVLPEGQELPNEITSRAKYQSALVGESSVVPPQWVVARGRIMAQKKLAAGETWKPDCSNISGYESDLNILRAGKQLVLFFKVGSNWLDLAWVLFDGIQTDPETVRMIKDIQLKNADSLTDQIHDLMQRWWKKKENDATIEELQKALDTIHMAYIHEEYCDPKSSFIPHTDTEDDLDVGEVSDVDPNVSRLVQEYEVRSMNTTFNAESSGPPLVQELDPEVVLRKLQQAKGAAPGSMHLYTRASRTSRADSSRDSSFERCSKAAAAAGRQTSDQESLNDSSGGEEKRTVLVVSQKTRKNNMKHETNL